jgi:hypothetical protein
MMARQLPADFDLERDGEKWITIGGSRYALDQAHASGLKAIAQLRAEGWVPPEERGRPASIAPQVAQDHLAHA